MNIKKFKLNTQRFDHEVGTICYEFFGYDYGLSRDDSYRTSYEHISVTLDQDGNSPFFTIPVNHLEEMYDNKTTNA